MTTVLKFNTIRPQFGILVLVTILGISVVGCARFQDKPLNPADSSAHIEARTLSNPSLRKFIESVVDRNGRWPVKAWDIDRLTLAAIYYHPDLALARAQADTADAAITTAGQRPNPNLTLSPTWVTNLASAATPWIIAAYINLPIETAGKRGFRLDKTQHLSHAAHLRIVDAAWVVRGRLRLAMLEVYAAQEAERLLQQQVTIQQAITQHLEQQRFAGEITRIETMRSHLALNQMKLNASTARKRIAESRVLLATAIGIPMAVLAGIEFDFSPLTRPPDLHHFTVASLRAIALQKRPDVLAALADYAAAQSALQLEIANQYPNIQANPGYTFDLGANYWTLGATALQLPIFHQNQGLIAEAEAKRQELAVRFEALQLRIMGDIDRVHAGLSAVFVKWRDAEMQMQLQQDNMQSAKLLFQAGETDRLALLAVELENAVAERARLDVLVESQQVLNGLEDTLRYPISSTLTQSSISESAMRQSSR